MQTLDTLAKRLDSVSFGLDGIPTAINSLTEAVNNATIEMREMRLLMAAHLGPSPDGFRPYIAHDRAQNGPEREKRRKCQK